MKNTLFGKRDHTYYASCGRLCALLGFLLWVPALGALTAATVL